jgi:hypothetical protein
MNEKADESFDSIYSINIMSTTHLEFFVCNFCRPRNFQIIRSGDCPFLSNGLLGMKSEVTESRTEIRGYQILAIIGSLFTIWDLT